jgi:Na+/melibiose symporter-like transporter
MASPGLSRAALLAYAAPAVPLAALTLPAYVFLPTFYAEGLGLGLGAVGAVLLAARLWDMVTDPVIGILSDRLPGRWGRRRPFVLGGLPVVVLSVWMLFRPGEDPGLWHLAVWSFALHLGWTLMILPLSAMGAELSGDYHERSRIAGYREGGVLLGTVVALVLPVAIVGIAAPPGPSLGVVAVFVAVALPLGVAAFAVMVPDPPVSEDRRRPAGGLRVLWRNGPLRRLVAAHLINSTANGLPATLFVLFVTHVLVMGDRAGVFLLAYFLAGILAVPLWVWLGRRLGKHRAWAAAMLVACAAFVFAPFLGAGDWIAYGVIVVVTGLCLGADLVLPASIQADVVDVDRLMSGHRRAGLMFAFWGMITKLSLALAVGIAFPLLDLAGFSEQGDNSPRALLALSLLYAGLPVILKIVAIVLMRDYPITASRQRALRQDLHEAGAAEAAGGQAEDGGGR